jgi:MFS family permease
VIGLAKKSQRYSRRSAVLEAQINYKIFFTNIRAMTAIISSMFAMVFMLFYEPVLSNYLEHHFDVSENVVGYLFSIGCFTYAFASPFVGIMCAKIPRRYVTLSAFLMVTISMFLLGPSTVLNIPDKLGVTLAGIGALGFSVSFVFVPLLPEIVAAVSEKEGIEQTPFLCDKASGIFNSKYGIGNCAAPLIGAALNQNYGFSVTCDIMGFSSLFFFFFYFFFAVLPALIQKPKTHDPLQESLPDNSMTMDGNLE